MVEKLDTELYETRTEILGADSVDFVTNDATYIRLQVILRGKIKVIPSDLIEDIAKLIHEYDVNKENK